MPVGPGGLGVLHPRHREPVIPLAAHGLDRRRDHPVVRRQVRVEAPLGLGRRVIAVPLGQGAAADHVVGDDQGARAGAVDGPGEVVGGVDLVGVDEGEVEGADALALQGRQGLQGGADADLDAVADAGAVDAAASDLGVLGVCLQREQLAVRRQGPVTSLPGRPNR